MTNLSQHNNGATVIAEDTEVYLDRDSVYKSQQDRITAPALQRINSLPPVREKKILEVRQQLADGTYDIDRRLGVAIDYFLEGMIG